MDVPTQHLVIPFLTLTPENCRVVAERGRAVIGVLGRDKVGRVLRNRWTAALQRLDLIADRGIYGPGPADLQIDLQAIVLATDFFQIASIMPSDVPDHIGRELAKALEGKLERSISSRVAEEFLSQFWFGLVMARAGVAPRVPKVQPDRSTPDYIVLVDSLECAVEVKRPESMHSTPDRMDKAASQLRDHGKPGFIAMDLTDALCPPEMSLQFMDSPGLAPDVIRRQFIHFTTQLEGRARKYSLSNKYERILGLALFARLHYWETADLSQPNSKCFLSVTALEGACNGLVLAQAQKLKRIIGDGAKAVSGGAVRRL